jgi:hypothetical protein
MFAKNARKSEEIASHRFGIVVLKIGLSVSVTRKIGFFVGLVQKPFL